MNPWIPLLKKLDLSRTEQEVVKRFEADPVGRSFLPVADILRSYRYADESLELLVYGVMHHPTFTVARIVLVRELLQKGLVTEAWQTLEESKTPLRENVLAQKLRFKLAILLGHESIVRSTYRHLKLHQMTDGEISRIGELLEVSGLGATRDRLIQEMKNRGVSPILPTPSSAAATEESTDVTANNGFGVGGGEATAELYQAHDNAEGRFGGFQVIALEEIFHGVDDKSGTHPGPGGIELDSSTLAEIYEHQGHYEKAIAVYRRLLRLTPSNDFIKAKISELASKKQRQKDEDLAVDPAIADSMEQIEVIDVQMKFYRALLERLN
jgi:tetratricopeptide (TPR) repeat protein